jgi:hypothetical protein
MWIPVLWFLWREGAMDKYMQTPSRLAVHDGPDGRFSYQRGDEDPRAPA